MRENVIPAKHEVSLFEKRIFNMMHEIRAIYESMGYLSSEEHQELLYKLVAKYPELALNKEVKQ